MVAILSPDLSATFVIEALLLLAVGFAVGLLIRKAIEIGTIVAVILLFLIVAGFLSPDQVLKPLIGSLKSGSSAAAWVRRVAGYLPISSMASVIGLIVGLLK